jgi:hypothetical protein
MDDVVRKALDDYGKIPPQDLRDTEVHMSSDTMTHIMRTLPASTDGSFNTYRHWRDTSSFLGLPLRVEESLPCGVVNFVTETELDRVIRRAAREGRAVNVMKPILFDPTEFPSVPVPTFKALLKHWWRKVKR